MTKEEHIKHWVETSDSDFKTMENLFKSKDYTWSLFVGHLVLEKLLKACYSKKHGDTAPPIHNLVRLAEMSELNIDQDRKHILAEINAFNIQTRYPDYKKELYKKCTAEFTDKYLQNIKELRKWLRHNLTK